MLPVHHLRGQFLVYGVLVAVGLLSCGGQPREEKGAGGTRVNREPDVGTQILGRVTEVVPLATRESADRTRWSVEMSVVQILRSGPEPKVGGKVTLQIHSVVDVFLVDVSELKGRMFRITYQDVFANPYKGKLIVETP
jgi:hypothetical protein